MRSGVALWKTLLVTGVALVVVVVSSRDQVLGESGTWTVKAPMPTPRARLGVGVVNGILYAVGGDGGADIPKDYLSIVEAYDPTIDKWTARAPTPTVRVGSAVGVVNGIMYVVGGSCCSKLLGKVLDSVIAYEPTTDKWTAKAPMPTARSSLGVGVANGILYAVGGAGDYPNLPFLSTLEAYDPNTNTWTTKASMPTRRSSLAVGVVNGILYAVGGVGCCNIGENSTILSTVEAYNPTTNAWTTKAPMPTPRALGSVGVVDGILYAVGGAIPHIANTVAAYNPTRNTWTVRPPIPIARWHHAVGVVNGTMYVVGGISLSKSRTPPGDWTSQFTRDLVAFKP
jgi:N-acetylneuraminic acid mutarotase